MKVALAACGGQERRPGDMSANKLSRGSSGGPAGSVPGAEPATGKYPGGAEPPAVDSPKPKNLKAAGWLREMK